MSKTFALLIDIQERLTPVMDQSEQLVEKSVQLARGLELLEVPIITTEQYPQGLGSTIEALQPFVEAEHTYEKTRFNALIDPVRQQIEAQTDLESIILFGIEAHICVYQTALSLLEDYPHLTIYLVDEALASRQPDHKALALDQLRTAGAQIVSIESLLFLLLEDAAHPQFKAISQLIK